jgi:hypothetical protein
MESEGNGPMKRRPVQTDSLRYLIAAIFLGALLLNLIKWSQHPPAPWMAPVAVRQTATAEWVQRYHRWMERPREETGCRIIIPEEPLRAPSQTDWP